MIVPRINKALRDFGLNFRGELLFRVVFSDEQFEMRRGEFNEFSPSGLIFLRTVETVKKCKKYPVIKGKWILEKWIPPDACYTDEIVSAQGVGTYECIYIFQDIDRNYLEPNYEVTMIIMKSLGIRKNIPSELEQDNEIKKEKEDNYQFLQKQREENMKIDMKYPDGTNANKYTDGFFIQGAGEKENAN